MSTIFVVVKICESKTFKRNMRLNWNVQFMNGVKCQSGIIFYIDFIVSTKRLVK